MKYIFYFDDVLFYTTRRRNEHLYPFLEKLGIKHGEIDEYYKKMRGNKFSMENLLKHFSLDKKFYREIMGGSKSFLNIELIKIVEKIGKESCCIITYGDKKFQLDKIKSTGIASLFSKIIVVTTDEKKKIIEKICAKYKNEKIVFIDDKIKHLENIDFKKCSNLKTILYDGKGLQKLVAEVQKD